MGYWSWNAFAKRREGLRRIVESQLWVAGERAVEAIETALQKYEDGILTAERLLPLSTAPEDAPAAISPASGSGEKVFLLDADYRVLFPRVGDDDAPYDRWQQVVSDSPFVSLFERAEYLEFVEQKFGQAAELYDRCRHLTPMERLQAYALAGRGRCLFILQRYEEAFSVFEELLREYGRFKNRLGHPYGVMAALQLHEIAVRQGRQGLPLEDLVSAFARLKNGAWSLKGSTYNFYATEIENILKKEFAAGRYPELQQHFETVKAESSPYLEDLEFARLLEENIVPIIKEKIASSEYANEPQKGRVSLTVGESRLLISFSRLGDVQSGRLFYGGFCWDLDHIKNHTFPEIAADIEKATRIQVRIIEPSDSDPESDRNQAVPEKALTMVAGRFLLPWRYVVTQNAVENLRREALRENVLNGLLLVVLVGLMSLGAFLLARDVTRQEEMAIQRSKFLDNISHELKTPLTLIRLYGETLKNQRHLPEESRREAYEVITGESERLSYLINNVLDFSRIGREGREFNFKAGSLAQAVKSTLESYRYHLEKKGFTIREDIATDLPPVVFDREAMASVVINLLSNAMKFSAERKDVVIRVFQNGDQAVLQIADRGVGISRQDIGRIFERFYRSRTGDVPGPAGTGLGLPIVKHIVEAHGGKIEVESEPEKGSVFSVFLPFAAPREEGK
ncbi:MAG: ATP-binding protein [Candidatus Aminicenantes bacterium]|nr:ATP-binding protein [Candidatus Aminicenantes bacterium]